MDIKVRKYHDALSFLLPPEFISLKSIYNTQRSKLVRKLREVTGARGSSKEHDGMGEF
ncbi:hypothetical protein E2C01_033837 [Portunus trituberculatus]|uniref:Uncharacterized protein n=1 Tax=Portunus trituberculatus TaxID=210409 RepID=A0A5B7EZW9_PORTR|nr:hypothetical protein [Portunus trituberculatus]